MKYCSARLCVSVVSCTSLVFLSAQIAFRAIRSEAISLQVTHQDGHTSEQCIREAVLLLSLRPVGATLWVKALFNRFSMLQRERVKVGSGDPLCSVDVPSDVLCHPDHGPGPGDALVMQGNKLLVGVVGSAYEHAIPSARLECLLLARLHIPKHTLAKFRNPLSGCASVESLVTG